MDRTASRTAEVFVLAKPLPAELRRKDTRKVYPPRRGADGKFLFSELMDWSDFMDDVIRTNSNNCNYFRTQLQFMSVHDADRARSLICQTEKMAEFFELRDPELIQDQQRCKDLAMMLFCELMVCAGHDDCLQSSHVISLARQESGNSFPERWWRTI